jgi:Bacterial type II and III secretion system protein
MQILQPRFMLSVAVLLASCGAAMAQLTITDPGKPGESIRQVSLSTSALNANTLTTDFQPTTDSNLDSRAQIRVTVQYLQVDKETRAAIYSSLSQDSLKSSIHVPATAETTALVEHSPGAACQSQTVAPGRITTCVLNEADSSAIMQRVKASLASEVSRAPNLILLDGKEAELNDLVQRPFVVDMQPDGDIIKPVVNVLAEGTRLRLLAGLGVVPDGSEGIQLTAEVQISRILDVGKSEVYGLSEEPMTVQVPLHHIGTSSVQEVLAKGQAILIDPHLTRTSMIQSNAKVPLLGKLPIVGRSFNNVSAASVEQNLLVILQPAIERNDP